MWGGVIDTLGSYQRQNFNQCPIVNPMGISPTYTENHGEVIAIIEVMDE